MKSPAGQTAAKKNTSPLVVTNKNRKKGVDFSKPTMPATFQSKYSEHRMMMEGNQHRKTLNSDLNFTDDPSIQNGDYRMGNQGVGWTVGVDNRSIGATSSAYNLSNQK